MGSGPKGFTVSRPGVAGKAPCGWRRSRRRTPPRDRRLMSRSPARRGSPRRGDRGPHELHCGVPSPAFRRSGGECREQLLARIFALLEGVRAGDSRLPLNRALRSSQGGVDARVPGTRSVSVRMPPYLLRPEERSCLSRDRQRSAVAAPRLSRVFAWMMLIMPPWRGPPPFARRRSVR